jgi:hypothetical protein
MKAILHLALPLTIVFMILALALSFLRKRAGKRLTKFIRERRDLWRLAPGY